MTAPGPELAASHPSAWLSPDRAQTLAVFFACLISALVLGACGNTANTSHHPLPIGAAPVRTSVSRSSVVNTSGGLVSVPDNAPNVQAYVLRMDSLVGRGAVDFLGRSATALHGVSPHPDATWDRGAAGFREFSAALVSAAVGMEHVSVPVSLVTLHQHVDGFYRRVADLEQNIATQFARHDETAAAAAGSSDQAFTLSKNPIVPWARATAALAGRFGVPVPAIIKFDACDGCALK